MSNDLLVNILLDWSVGSRITIQPLRVFKSQLKNNGIKIKYHFRSTSSMTRGDVLLIIGHFFRPTRFNPRPPNRNSFLQEHQAKIKTLIWLDITDSAGQTSFGVIPYVDLYAKNDLYRDRSLYSTRFYGDRLYTDFYHQIKGLSDNQIPASREILKDQDLHKLALAWNLGLGDYRYFHKSSQRFQMVSPWANYQPEAISTLAPRDIDISFRGTLHYKHATASFQREETFRQLGNLNNVGKYKVAYEGKIPYKEYIGELNRTKIALSPFGKGEVCYRDFESFLAGAMLLKPDMSHIETWPNYYETGVTYVPHAWDFSDFEARIEALLADSQKRLQIAQAGQARYLHSLSPQGGELFAQHFGELLQKASANSSSRHS